MRRNLAGKQSAHPPELPWRTKYTWQFPCEVSCFEQWGSAVARKPLGRCCGATLETRTGKEVARRQAAATVCLVAWERLCLHLNVQGRYHCKPLSAFVSTQAHQRRQLDFPVEPAPPVDEREAETQRLHNQEMSETACLSSVMLAAFVRVPVSSIVQISPAILASIAFPTKNRGGLRPANECRILSR